MTTFDERDKAFENKFAHDEELLFKAIARRNKLLGAWASAKLGKIGKEAEQYAKDVVLADFESAGDNDVIEKLLKDFAKVKVAMNAKDIRAEMDRLLLVAKKQILGEEKR